MAPEWVILPDDFDGLCGMAMGVLNHCSGCSDHNDMTTAELCSAWLSERRRVSASPASARVWATYARGWSAWVGADSHPWEIDREDIIAWITAPPSRHTMRGRRAWLVSLYRWAHAVHGWPSPMTAIPAISVPDAHHPPIPDDVLEQAKQTSDQTTRKMLALGRLAGMRAGEIASARAAWLDGTHVRITGKGARERVIAAHPVVRSILRESQGNPSGLVFPSPTRHGEPWQGNSVSHKLGNALPDPYTAHSLRRAFAHALYRATGNDIELVRQSLGHASVKTTQVYLGVRSSEADAHIQSMAW